MRYSFQDSKGKKGLVARVLERTGIVAIHRSPKRKRVVSGLRSFRGNDIPLNVIKTIVDTLSFKKIFLAWIGLILVFGLIYFGIGSVSPDNGLRGIVNQGSMGSFLDAIYFSFIAATSTGFGDIVPLGLSRLISVFEVIAGLTMFGILISKLVSFKQEVIVSEIYDISLGEKVNRLRSALYLFRSDMSSLMDRLSSGRMHKAQVRDLWVTLNNLRETLMDVQALTCVQDKGKEYLKRVEDFQLELLLNSMRLSFKSLDELLAMLSAKKVDWKSPENLRKLNSVIGYGINITDFHKRGRSSESVIKRVGQLEKILERLLPQGKA